MATYAVTAGTEGVPVQTTWRHDVAGFKISRTHDGYLRPCVTERTPVDTMNVNVPEVVFGSQIYNGFSGCSKHAAHQHWLHPPVFLSGVAGRRCRREKVARRDFAILRQWGMTIRAIAG